MTVLITLITAGSDSGPFNLYSNLDGYTIPFETGVSKLSLLAGYNSTTVPDYTNIIRIKSSGNCVNFVDISLTNTTTSTTSTTTTAAPTGNITIETVSGGPSITLQSVSNYAWTNFTISDFPVTQDTSIIGGHFGYSGSLTIVGSVSVDSRVEITKNATSYLCVGQIGTGSQNYVFPSVVFAPTDDVVITLIIGDVCI